VLLPLRVLQVLLLAVMLCVGAHVDAVHGFAAVLVLLV
jgi:hypothetical protein